MTKVGVYLTDRSTPPSWRSSPTAACARWSRSQAALARRVQLGPDGWLYVTCSALQDVLFRSAAARREHAPYQIYRFKPGRERPRREQWSASRLTPSSGWGRRCPGARVATVVPGRLSGHRRGTHRSARMPRAMVQRSLWPLQLGDPRSAEPVADNEERIGRSPSPPWQPLQTTEPRAPFRRGKEHTCAVIVGGGVKAPGLNAGGSSATGAAYRKDSYFEWRGIDPALVAA